MLTRDLGLAAFLLQLPGPAAAAARLRIPRRLGRSSARKCRRCSASPRSSRHAGKLERLDRRERRVWRRAEAYVTITRALRDELAVEVRTRARRSSSCRTASGCR